MDYIHLNTKTNVEFVATSVTLLEGIIHTTIANRDQCILGLSGGSTPRAVYMALGQSQEIDWSKVWLFLVDERHTSTKSNESNAKLILETLLAHAPLPPMQFIHPIDLPLEKWQQEYENALAQLLRGRWPDVVILGMGEDGHIASLFPPVADGGMGPGLTVHTTTDQFAVHDRISVTVPVLSNAQAKIFLLSGKRKKATWEEMIASDENERRWPAKALLSQRGCTLISQWQDS